MLASHESGRGEKPLLGLKPALLLYLARDLTNCSMKSSAMPRSRRTKYSQQVLWIPHLVLTGPDSSGTRAVAWPCNTVRKESKRKGKFPYFVSTLSSVLHWIKDITKSQFRSNHHIAIPTWQHGPYLDLLPILEPPSSRHLQLNFKDRLNITLINWHEEERHKHQRHKYRLVPRPLPPPGSRDTENPCPSPRLQLQAGSC